MGDVMRRRFAWAAAAAVFTLALAGCGGDDGGGGVASAGGANSASPSASSSASRSDYEAMLEFTECMRGEGIEMEDPQPGQGVQLQIQGDPAKVQAAMAKCRHLLPNGGEPQQANPEQLEQARQFAKCMRDNGVPNFPDPDPETGGIIVGGPGSGIDPNDPNLAAAQRACEKLQPTGAGAGG
jgi:hypothetical protein